MANVAHDIEMQVDEAAAACPDKGGESGADSWDCVADQEEEGPCQDKQLQRQQEAQPEKKGSED